MIYLDHNAITPMRPAAIAAVERALRVHGNPSSVHAAGRAARPAAWIELGLPCTPSARSTAARASGRRGVMALWSR